MPKLFSYYRFTDFLDQHVLADLMDFTTRNEAHYGVSKLTKAGSTTTDLTKRHSLTSLNLGEFKEIFVEQINKRQPELFHRLNMSVFDIKKYECQLSAYGDGAFFEQHIDTITHKSDGESSRAISIVFYYHSEPKAFEGGELVIHPLPFLPGHDQPVILTPINNSLVVFPSVAPHEVLPVRLQNSAFSHYRFSLNCWLHQ